MRYSMSVYGLLFLVLTACTSTMGNSTIRNSQALSSIQRGVTTKPQVQALLGEPQRRSIDARGMETWHYTYSEAKIDNATFIPIYGLFAGGAQSNSTEVLVEFANGQVVSNYTTTNGNYHYKNFGD